jgi:hypothetical protein
MGQDLPQLHLSLTHQDVHVHGVTHRLAGLIGGHRFGAHHTPRRRCLSPGLAPLLMFLHEGEMLRII